MASWIVGSLSQQLLGLAATVHDGGVVAAAEVAADLLEALAGAVPGEVDGHAAGGDQRPAPHRAPQVGQPQRKMPRRGQGNLVQARLPPPVSLRQVSPGGGQVDRRPLPIRPAPANCSSAPANSGTVPLSPSAKACGDRLRQLRRPCSAANCRRMASRASGPGGANGIVSPAVSRLCNARQEAGQLGRRRRGRHHHPSLFGQQGVQRVNQFLLGAQLARLPRGQHAEVFEDQQGGRAILGAELLDRLALDGVGQFAGEIDGRGADHALPAIAGLPHGRQTAGEVRLARAAGPVQHQRIVAARAMRLGCRESVAPSPIGGSASTERTATSTSRFSGPARKWQAGAAPPSSRPLSSLRPGRGMSTTPSTMSVPSCFWKAAL